MKRQVWFYISIPDEEVLEISGESSDLTAYPNKKDIIESLTQIIEKLEKKYNSVDIQICCWNDEKE